MSDIADTLQAILKKLTRMEKNFDNLRDDVKIIDEKVDNLRDETAVQAGDIEAISRQSLINKKKQAIWQILLQGRYTQLFSD